MAAKKTLIRRKVKKPPSPVVERKKAGPKVGVTAIVADDLKTRVADLYLAGQTVAEIAQQVDRSERTIYAYLADTRMRIISAKKEHFDERIALLLDDQLDSIATHHRLLSDESFNKSADPERLKAIGQNIGILTDKCFLLLASANSRNAKSAQHTSAAGTGSD